MSQLRRLFSIFSAPLLVGAGVIWASGTAMAQNPSGPSPLVQESALKRLSEHSYVIEGFPNIGIVVGNHATLVIDTGMGPRNGATVARVAEKLAHNPVLYLTTTHYHPEHATGEQAFPPGTILIRPAIQQEEMERMASRYIDLFRSRSALNRELLQGLKPRQPDMLFDREVKLDLGGVTARLFWLGAAHTEGDELIFVEPDRVLYPGDIVQNKLVPNLPDEDASMKGWIAVLDKLEPLKPRIIVPDHGALGDASLIGQERAFLVDLQGRAIELKREGKSVEEAGQLLTTEFEAKYPGWESMRAIPNAVRRVYAETQ
jgi:glyoxylase-like metal-dependent hydrolase (beta-lactamase superfamily II)